MVNEPTIRRVQEGKPDLPLAECIGSKLPTATAVLVEYVGEDGLNHVHVHTKGGGREGTAAFLEYLRDEYLPQALRMLRS